MLVNRCRWNREILSTLYDENGLMKNFNVLIAALLGLCFFVSCEEDGLEVVGFEEEHAAELENYAMSAGTATTFMNSSLAYDNENDWIRSNTANFIRWKHGNSLYDRASVDQSGNTTYGPVYAGYSCNSCHIHAGRTSAGTWNLRNDGTYGSGENGMSAMLVYVTRKNGVFFQNYGRVLHDQSILGITTEGKLRVDWTFEEGQFPDGELYELARPSYTITDWYAPGPDGHVPQPDELFCTVRIPLRHVGMGQMMALDPQEIEALAKQSNYPEYGISGRCNYITERGIKQLGLSGNKAQHADLTVELGFSSDMGTTNSRYPEEICEGQLQMQEGSMMGLLYDKLDISTKEMEDVDLYMHGLGVPARRLGSKTLAVSVTASDGSVKTMTERELVARGEQMFYQAKCHLCHVTTLHTKTRGATLLNGTQLPLLGGQTIHPYSDYLLHDMGSEIMGVGLNDNYVSGLARGNEWRTTPLWGIGLQKKVNGHTYFLHDGRARNFIEAILWHGGEGEASKKLFMKMDRSDRSALIKFLESL